MKAVVCKNWGPPEDLKIDTKLCAVSCECVKGFAMGIGACATVIYSFVLLVFFF